MEMTHLKAINLRVDDAKPLLSVCIHFVWIPVKCKVYWLYLNPKHINNITAFNKNVSYFQIRHYRGKMWMLEQKADIMA